MVPLRNGAIDLVRTAVMPVLPGGLDNPNWALPSLLVAIHMLAGGAALIATSLGAPEPTAAARTG